MGLLTPAFCVFCVPSSDTGMCVSRGGGSAAILADDQEVCRDAVWAARGPHESGEPSLPSPGLFWQFSSTSSRVLLYGLTVSTRTSSLSSFPAKMREGCQDGGPMHGYCTSEPWSRGKHHLMQLVDGLWRDGYELN